MNARQRTNGIAQLFLTFALLAPAAEGRGVDPGRAPVCVQATLGAEDHRSIVDERDAIAVEWGPS